MKIGKNGLDLIKEFEGCYLKAYKCPAGVWTISYGVTGKVDGVPIHEGMTITKEKAESLLLEKLKSYENAVNNLNINFNQNQYDALVSFCYNLGTGIFKGTLLDALKKKNWDSATKQMLLYNKAKVNGVLTVLSGLDRRRKAEVKLFNTPVTNSPTEDKELAEAVSVIIKSGINIEFNSWKATRLFIMKNVPFLLDKLGGLDKLVADGVISDAKLWREKTYKETHIRALLVKYALLKAKK